MKSKVMSTHAGKAIEDIPLLQQEIKETLLPGSGSRRYRQLTAAGLWNLQRQGRSASARLRRWNLN